MNLRRIAACLALAAALATAQQSSPAFEVASIRPHSADDNRFRVKPPPNGRFTATGCVAKLLVMLACGVQESQVVGGPGWFDIEKWDVESKSADQRQYSVEETRQMLQDLLVQRFSLQIHRETRQFPVYVLAVAKGGPKFKAQQQRDRVPNVQITANSVHLAPGAVIDHTGLVQLYDLSWSGMTRRSLNAACPA